MAATDPYIVVFGFGSQGSVQSKNLRDSGCRVAVAIRPTSRRARHVSASGLSLMRDLDAGARQADIACILIPDSEQQALWRRHLDRNLRAGSAVVFAHGFNIHHRFISPRPDLDIILVAPLGQAEAVRSEYLKGSGVPCALAVHQDATGRAWNIAEYYARKISPHGALIRSTFAEETESDLFAEQAVLCGGLNQLIRAAFDTLVAAGHNPELAYFACLREVRALAKLLYKHGIDGARRRISDTARYGDVTRGPRIIDDHVRATLKAVFDEIRTGAFAREYDEEVRSGFARLNQRLDEDRGHLIEKVHASLAEKPRKR